MWILVIVLGIAIAACIGIIIYQENPKNQTTVGTHWTLVNYTTIY